MASSIGGNHGVSGSNDYENSGIGGGNEKSSISEGMEKPLQLLEKCFSKVFDRTTEQINRLQQIKVFSSTKKTVEKTTLFSSLVESFIRNEGWLKTEGIFRISGSILETKRECTRLKAISQGQQIQFETNNSHVAAGALKALLRDMQFLKDPESKKSGTLSSQESRLLALVNLKTKEEKQQELIQWFNGLSVDQQKTILMIQKLVFRVEKDQETNKMGVSNLARILGPNVVIFPESLGLEVMNKIGEANQAVQFLLENLSPKKAFLHQFNKVGDDVFRYYFENVEGTSQDLLKIPSYQNRLDADKLLVQLSKKEKMVSDLSDEQVKSVINTLMEEYIRFYQEGFDHTDEILLRKPLQTWGLLLERGEKPCSLEKMTEEYTKLNEMAALVMGRYCDKTPKGARTFPRRLSPQSQAQAEGLVEKIHLHQRRLSGLTTEEQAKVIRWVGERFFGVLSKNELRNSLEMRLLGLTYREVKRILGNIN